MTPAPSWGSPRGNNPRENPCLHGTTHRHEPGPAGEMDYVSVVTNTKSYLHIYTPVKGKKTEEEKLFPLEIQILLPFGRPSISGIKKPLASY